MISFTRRKPAVINLLLSMLLAALTFYAFGSILDNAFILYDDPGYITENPHVLNGLSLDSIKWAFSTTLTGNFIPLTWLSHMLDAQLYSSDPTGHHLTGLIIHIANVLLVFALFQHTTKQPAAAALAALLFAIHPLRVESVAWASERKDVLSAFFGLSALITYALYTRRQGSTRPFFYVLTLVLLTGGLLSKAMLVTWPFLFFILDFWPLDRFSSTKAKDRHLLAEKLPFFVLGILFSVIAFYAQRVEGAVHMLEDTPVHLRLANAVVSYARYLYKFAWPAEMPLLYPLNMAILTPVHILLSTVLLTVLTGLFFALRKTLPFLLSGWLWFLGTLIPVIGLVQIGNQSIANRYMYIPSIGLSIMIAFAANRLALRSRGLCIACVTLFACLVAALTFWTVVHSMLWKNSLSVFSYAVHVAPENNYVMHMNLGTAFLKKDRYNAATDAFQKARTLNPQSSEPLTMLGETAVRQGHNRQAIKYLNQAIELKADLGNESAYNNLAIAYARLDCPEAAADWFDKALTVTPDNPEILSNAAIAFRDSAQYEKAVACLEKALLLRPEFTPDLRKLASILLIDDSPVYNPSRALTLAQTGCRLANYKNADCLITLAQAHLALGNVSKARSALQTAAEQLPTDASSKTKIRFCTVQSALPDPD